MMSRARAMGFRGRLLMAMTALVVLVGLSIAALTMIYLFEDEQERAGNQLVLAERVANEVLDRRTDVLLSQWRVVARDFGFRSAIASGNRATLDSALSNHSQRAGADLALLLDRDLRVLASTHHQGSELPAAFDAILASDPVDGVQQGFVYWQGQGYRMVVIPVNGGGLRAQLLAGFRLDDNLARLISRLTGTDTVFRFRTTAPDTNAPATKEQQVLGSSLAPAELQQAGLTPDTPDQPIADGGYFVRIMALTNSADRDFETLLLIDRKDSLVSYYRRAAEISLLIGGSLILAILLAMLAARTLGRPILELARYAAAIGDNRQLDAPGQYRYGELATLSDSLEKMQAKIRHRERRIHYNATHDETTGLLNRLALVVELKDRLQRRQPVNVIGLSLLGLSDINDTLGLGFGDQLLTATGLRLKSQVPPGAVFARSGGNEFIALVDRMDDDALRQLLADLQRHAEEPLRIKDAPFAARCRIAVLRTPEDAGNVDEVRRRLNLTMERAGQQENRIAFYSPGEDEFRLRELQLIRELQTAIQSGTMHMNYQPKVDFRTGELVQVEALVRWIHPDFGFVSPEEFILLAERSGQIHDLTRFILARIAEDASAWYRGGLTVGPAINLSALDLSRPELVDDILQAFRDFPGGYESLTMEVTESAVMDDTVTALETLTRIRKAGIKLSIDDFGTGHSSLAQMRKLPVQELKIDKTFVLNLEQDTRDQLIVRSTINMAHGLGLRVVAEGIESLGSWQLLRQWGCDLGQGFYLARPMAAADLPDWCQRLADMRPHLLPESPTVSPE